MIRLAQVCETGSSVSFNLTPLIHILVKPGSTAAVGLSWLKLVWLKSSDTVEAPSGWVLFSLFTAV